MKTIPTPPWSTHGNYQTSTEAPMAAIDTEAEEAARRDAGHFLRVETETEMLRLVRGAPGKVQRVATALLSSTARLEEARLSALEEAAKVVDWEYRRAVGSREARALLDAVRAIRALATKEKPHG